MRNYSLNFATKADRIIVHHLCLLPPVHGCLPPEYRGGGLLGTAEGGTSVTKIAGRCN